MFEKKRKRKGGKTSKMGRKKGSAKHSKSHQPKWVRHRWRRTLRTIKRKLSFKDRDK